MDRPNYFSLLEESIETDFTINGRMEFVLSTDFSSREFNEIFNTYPLLPYPIVLDDNDQPVIVNAEPLRDYEDMEIRDYNDRMSQYRLAAQLKLMIKETDDIEKLSVEDIVEILDSCSTSVYWELENKIDYILKAKFQKLQESRMYMARKVLAFTKEEKLQRDEQKKEIAKERDKLFKRQDEIAILLKDCEDAEQIKLYEDELKEIEKKTDQLRRLLVSDIEDNVRTECGITPEYVTFELAKTYMWSPEFTIKVLSQNLSREEEIYVELARAKYSLDAEESKRQYDKINKKTK